jgi:hypothetical protein
MKKKPRVKCTKKEFCDEAHRFHQKGQPEGKGLQMSDVIQIKTHKRGRRIGYREERRSHILWFSYCPWCGVSQKTMRERSPE